VSIVKSEKGFWESNEWNETTLRALEMNEIGIETLAEMKYW
jgi:hypothetical protein